MKSISKILVTIVLLLSFTSCNAQIKNAKTVTVKIYGNCGMCEKTIEKAGSINKLAKVDWNEDSKMATITYDEKQTSQDEILKRIALAGYDSDKFLAPDDTYSKLHGCCQYDREAKVAVSAPSDTATAMNHSNHGNHAETSEPESQQENQLKAVFENYFSIKDALVKTDSKNTSASAKDLLTSINTVQMEKLKDQEHIVWMKILKELKEDASQISKTTDIEKQRTYFMALSKNMYDLIKVSKTETPTYYQFCPMANDGKGANWLSKENAIKNPYYGSQMLSCGKTVETIK